MAASMIRVYGLGLGFRVMDTYQWEWESQASGGHMCGWGWTPPTKSLWEEMNWEKETDRQTERVDGGTQSRNNH